MQEFAVFDVRAELTIRMIRKRCCGVVIS